MVESFRFDPVAVFLCRTVSYSSRNTLSPTAPPLPCAESVIRQQLFLADDGNRSCFQCDLYPARQDPFVDIRIRAQVLIDLRRLFWWLVGSIQYVHRLTFPPVSQYDPRVRYV